MVHIKKIKKPHIKQCDIKTLSTKNIYTHTIINDGQQCNKEGDNINY